MTLNQKFSKYPANAGISSFPHTHTHTRETKKSRSLFNFRHITLVGKVVRVPKKVPPPKKKNTFPSQCKVLGEGVSDQNIKCFRSKYKGFPNFLLFSLRFQCFSNLLLHCQIKTSSGPLTEKRGFYFGTIFKLPFRRPSYLPCSLILLSPPPPRPRTQTTLTRLKTFWKSEIFSRKSWFQG